MLPSVSESLANYHDHAWEKMEVEKLCSKYAAG